MLSFGTSWRGWRVIVGAFALSIVATVTAVSAQAIDFEFRLLDQSVTYDPATGEGSGSLEIEMVEPPTSPGFPNNLQGWSLGVRVDPNHVELLAIVQGQYLQDLDGGTGPDFYTPTLYADGFTVATAYSFLGGVVCTYEIPRISLSTTFDLVASTFQGDPTGVDSPVEFDGTLGVPPVANEVIVGGFASPATLFDGTVTISPSGSSFVRGDCNASGGVDLADPIFLGGVLFIAGTGPAPCASACDANDDGVTDIADVVYVPSFLFAGGSAPPAPFGACGPDPTPDGLTCDDFLGLCP